MTGARGAKSAAGGKRQNASRLNLHLDEVTRQLVQGDDQAREEASVGQRLMKPCRHCHGGPASGVWLTPPYHWKDPEPGLQVAQIKLGDGLVYRPKKTLALGGLALSEGGA